MRHIDRMRLLPDPLSKNPCAGLCYLFKELLGIEPRFDIKFEGKFWRIIVWIGERKICSFRGLKVKSTKQCACSFVLFKAREEEWLQYMIEEATYARYHSAR